MEQVCFDGYGQLLAGTVGALSATMNAVCNALLPEGVRRVDMPATPVRVWQALHAAGDGSP